MRLSANSRIGIVGGGPSGAMTGFFLLEMAERLELPLEVDIYEPRDYKKYGPAGCNMCAGVVSESLIQTLAAEGIPLPSSSVIQSGIDSYVLHTSDLPVVTINTPVDEVRIATVFRGSGPRKPIGDQSWSSFDHFLLGMAQQKGANIVPERVTELAWDEGRPRLTTREGNSKSYDFLVGAVGVNSATLEKFAALGFSFESPAVSKGFLSEIYLGAEQVQACLGSSLHIFLLDIPRLKFAAIIPKVEYVTVCLLGENIDKALIQQFMESPEVRSCFPPDMVWTFADKSCDQGIGQACHCGPKLNLGPAINPFADRVAMVGDAAVTRLYKDGIGAAYITAKACAVTALFFGIAARDFQEHYQPVIQRIAVDNRIGRFVFWITLFYQEWNFLRRGMVQMVKEEQPLSGVKRRMSRVLWDTFTGSSTYREILIRALHPRFFFHLLSATLRALWAHLRK
ncbi:MAG: hypothetical protein HQL90_10975 [Magnetococcales bacterium]|nr:hypothetical protein [Magnetococcales bacterium]